MVIAGRVNSTVSAAAYGVGPAQAGMPALERFLPCSNPIAYLCWSLGAGAVTEISAPGHHRWGVILLILALIGLVRLPTNWVGVLPIIPAGDVLLDLKWAASP
jgi:membrane-bound ClpP family serine protease